MGGAQTVRRQRAANAFSGATFDFTKIGASRYDLSDPYHAALTVTLQHRLDSGPLKGLTEKQMREDEMRFFLTVETHDPALGADVHALHTYAATDVAWGRRYADAVSQSETGTTQADLTRISLLEPEI